jgi:hypothetical protein
VNGITSFGAILDMVFAYKARRQNMLRSLAFAIGLMVCFLSGWSTADAQGRVLPKVGKNAAKVIGQGTILAAKALKSLREFRHSEHGTNQVPAKLETLRYTINGWKLILHNPVQFNLPFRGNFELSEIDLKKPSAIAGGYACSQVENCVEFVKRVCASASIEGCREVTGD